MALCLVACCFLTGLRWLFFFFSSRRRHTRCALVTGVQTCALPIYPSVAAQRVAFGTSGHRGSSLDGSFNEHHVLAITQAICEYRKAQGIDGPLFLGIDTHALSKPACDSALEVLAANGVEVRVAAGGEFTPTPAVSATERGRVGKACVSSGVYRWSREI